MALISLTLAKAWLRAGDAEDDTINDLISSVVSHMENKFGVIVDEQTDRTWTFDRFEPFMLLPGVPVDPDTVAVAYLDADGAEQALSDVRAVMSGHHVRLLPAIGSEWPATADGGAVITVTGNVGWADNAVPADVTTAARLALATWYDDRSAPFPDSAADLLEPYQLRRV